MYLPDNICVLCGGLQIRLFSGVKGVASFITNNEHLQKTEAAFSPCRLNVLITFPFSKKNHMFHISALVALIVRHTCVKSSPWTSERRNCIHIHMTAFHISRLLA